jgi:excisionase family DNA binding protein
MKYAEGVNLDRDLVLIPLMPIGVLELPRAVFDHYLRKVEQGAAPAPPIKSGLVNAKALAALLDLPTSCIYEYARAGRIPAVRAGKHVRFNAAQVLDILQAGRSL